ERFGDNGSIKSGQIRSAICVPMIANDLAIGVIYIDLQMLEESTSPNYTRDELDLVSGIALQAGLALRNVHLVEDMRDRQRFEKELEIAREIQTNLLPRVYPEID